MYRYDRNLGGFEMDMRLRDYLAAKFTEKYPKVKLRKYWSLIG